MQPPSAQPPFDDDLAGAIHSAVRSGIVAFDREARVILVNDEFCRMVGFGRDEMVGARPPFPYWPPEHRDEIQVALRRILAGEYPVEGLDMVFRRKDGTSFPALLYVAPVVRDGEAVAWVANIVDVTAQKRQEEALRFREALFRDLAEHIEEVFYVSDPSAARMLYVSPSYERVWGRSCASLYADPVSFLDSIVPEHRAMQQEAFARQARGETTRTQYRIRRPDGTEAWIWDSSFPIVDDAGHLLRIVGMAADITEQKAGQETIRRHEQQLGMVLDAARIGFWEADLPTATVVYDKAWRDMLGLPADAPPPDWIFFHSRLHPDDVPRVAEMMMVHVAGGSDRFELEFRLRHQDGRWLWILSRGLIVERDASGAAVRMIGTHQDITEHRELETARRHTERLESVGSLTSGVAHNFNNLLAVILGSLERVLASPDATPALRSQLATAVRAAESGAELTRSLMALARREAPNVECVDVAARLRELQPLLAASLPSSVQLTAEDEAGSAPVLVDRGQLDSAIVNLVVNARDAVAGRGHVRLAVRRAEFDARDPVSVTHGLPPGAYVRISVADDGVGMDEDTQRRAFDPYFTTKVASGGTGLGLPTVYAFCRSSRGVAAIESSPGHGTTVHLLLPAASDAPATTVGAAPQAAAPPAQARVLVVEDNGPLRDLAAVALEDAGYAVTTAASIGEALALLDAGAFDVVFSDVMFDDGRSGLEVAERVRDRHAGTAMLLTSGVPLDAKASEASFLQKPYRIADLQAAVAAVLSAARA